MNWMRKKYKSILLMTPLTGVWLGAIAYGVYEPNWTAVIALVGIPLFLGFVIMFVFGISSFEGE